MLVVLDTSLILSKPEIFFLGRDDLKFVLPAAVIRQLRKSRLSQKIQALIETAQSTGRVQVWPDPGTPAIFEGKDLGTEDGRILQTALDASQAPTSEEVVLASHDKELISEARSRGLTAVDGYEFYHSLRTGEKAQASSLKDRKEIKQAVASLNQDNRRYLRNSAIAPIVALMGLPVLWQYREALLRTSPIWGLVLGSLIVALLLFWFRARYRLGYGGVEVFFGLLGIFQLSSSAAYDSVFFLQLTAGVYIIVRGLDNVGKGLQGTKQEVMWSRWFGEK